jgi:hypothetical protein
MRAKRRLNPRNHVELAETLAAAELSNVLKIRLVHFPIVPRQQSNASLIAIPGTSAFGIFFDASTHTRTTHQYASSRGILNESHVTKPSRRRRSQYLNAHHL